MTHIINLYGGPGSGKSTSAAFIYYILKSRGYNTELVREYVKDWAWEKRKITTYDEIYFLGKQVRRESMLYDKVDWIVTDSPVYLNLFYAKKFSTNLLSTGMQSSIISFYEQAKEDGHKHIHLFLKRTKPYSGHGRYQTQKEAEDIDHEMKILLNTLNVGFEEIDTEEEQIKEKIERIL